MEFSSFTEALSEDEFWPWLVIAGPIWILTYLAKAFLSQETTEPVSNEYIQMYSSLTPPMPSKEELKVPIEELRIYPLAGVQTTGPVDYIDLGPYGPKYDRDLTLLPAEGTGLPMKAWRHEPCAKLR